jgi:hypothetical protein
VLSDVGNRCSRGQVACAATGVANARAAVVKIICARHIFPQLRDNNILNRPIRIGRKRSQIVKTLVIKRLTTVCIGALLTLSAAPDAFGGRGVWTPRRGRLSRSLWRRCCSRPVWRDRLSGSRLRWRRCVSAGVRVRRCRGCRGRCPSRCRRRLRSGLELLVLLLLPTLLLLSAGLLSATCLVIGDAGPAFTRSAFLRGSLMRCGTTESQRS